MYINKLNMASNNEYEQQRVHHNTEWEMLKSLGLIATGFEGKWSNGIYTMHVSFINGAIIMTNIVKNGRTSND